MVHQILPVQDFLQQPRLLLDVRSPGEYQQGHIPGALSFPLFTDEERAAVGTIYKQQGPEVALELGLKYTGPKMAGFVRKARAMAAGRGLAVHCWRGGQRSKSMAWLLRLAGLDVVTLEGGYKAYRQWVLGSFQTSHWPLLVLGGKTGSGKTKVLHALFQKGQQILDLEALAHHKGSAFGWIGEQVQPSVEQFENDLYQALSLLQADRPIWVENESRSIGRVFIPDGFWANMKKAPLFNIEIPEHIRLNNLVQDYTHTHTEDLKAAFYKIERKLGGQHLKNALESLDKGDFEAAASIALVYYDKTYQHCLEENLSPVIHQIQLEHAHPDAIADLLISRI